MELRQYLQIGWKWLWLIVLGTLLAGGISYWVTSQLPPVYHASTSLLVTKGLTGDDPGDVAMDTYRAVTYKELLTKQPVIEAAAKTLGMPASEIEKKVWVRLIPNTALIELTVEDSDPNLAMEIANRIAAAFIEISGESGWIRVRDVIVVEPATVPTGPGRRTVKYTFLGTFAGFLFSVGVVFLLEYLNDSFETSADIRQTLALPTLGTIWRLHRRERASKLIILTHPHSLVSEAYRTLRTNIRFANVDEPLTTLLITSAEPGAGKTTVAANLAVACAQAGLQVVLIEADLRLPSLHQLFNLNNHSGLTDLLAGNIQNAEECMVSTGIDNLRLITSGPIPPNPSELLSSKKMETVLAEVQKSAELVIFDTSPVLAATDPAVLASKVDGVILVIEAKRTSREAARRACEAYQGVGATMLGAVLTKVQTGRKSSSYYHYAEERSRPTAANTEALAKQAHPTSINTDDNVK